MPQTIRPKQIVLEYNPDGVLVSAACINQITITDDSGALIHRGDMPATPISADGHAALLGQVTGDALASMNAAVEKNYNLQKVVDAQASQIEALTEERDVWRAEAITAQQRVVGEKKAAPVEVPPAELDSGVSQGGTGSTVPEASAPG